LTTHLHLVPRSKNEWSYISTPNMPSWHSAQLKHRDNFIFFLPFIVFIFAFILFSICALLSLYSFQIVSIFACILFFVLYQSCRSESLNYLCTYLPCCQQDKDWNCCYCTSSQKLLYHASHLVYIIILNKQLVLFQRVQLLN
jgi:hypothetical protein